VRPLRIGFLLPDYSDRSRSYMRVVLQSLAERGAVVGVVHPAEHAIDLSRVQVEYDLYVLRKMSGAALSLAGALHELGAAIVNPYPVSATLRDKIVTCRVLQAAGLPVPATFVAAEPEQLAPLLADGPLVLKPYLGAGGHHVRIVRDAAELAPLEREREPLFAQRYHAPQGRDRKLYVIGERIFGVKKVFPRRTHEERMGEPFAVTTELAEIARRCGRAFGIDLYGVDVIESDGQPYVVDMASIPGFKGVPDALTLLTEYFLAAAERAVRGELVTAS